MLSFRLGRGLFGLGDRFRIISSTLATGQSQFGNPEIQMSNEEQLEARLRELDERFVRQMRERGFEPSQAENIALPGPLAKLYSEREELRADLEKLKAEHSDEIDSEQNA